MTLSEMLTAEFEQEAHTTRKFLARMPDDKLQWQPHAKSMTAGQLALHIAQSPGQVLDMALADEMAPPNFGQPNPQPASTQEVLTAHDASVSKVRAALPKVTDAQMQAMWRLKIDGKEIMAMPRYNMLRSILLNHWIHHRGQFGVYLRMVGASVPSSYGPSGDEMPEFMQ